VVRNQTERIQGAQAGLGGDGQVEVESGPGEEVDGGQAVWIPTKRLDRGLGCGLSAVLGGSSDLYS
jgi:hypothetical protein